MIERRLLALISSFLLAASGCSQDTEGRGQSTPTAIQIEPANITLGPTDTARFSVVALDQTGGVTQAEPNWTATGGSITSSGLYTAGQTPGVFDVSVTDAGTGISATVQVTISDPGGGGGRITGVSWTCNSLVIDAVGSDLWPITWSDDGHQYTAWGDGNGLQGSDRFGYGISRIEGPPTSYVATDLGEFSPGGGGGKIPGIISVGGVLYMWRNEQDGSGTHTLVKSLDKGRSVQATSTAFTIGVDGLIPNNFVQFGQDNSDAIGGYVYFIANASGTSPTFLFRVQESQIETKASYEVFASVDPNNPSWSTDFARRQPVFNNPNASYWSGAYVTYIKELGEFILTERRELDMGVWAIYAGPKPWGPWTLIGEYTNWCNWQGQSTRTVLGRIIAPKWVGAVNGNELDFWMVFSGTGVWDRFNLVRGTISLR